MLKKENEESEKEIFGENEKKAKVVFGQVHEKTMGARNLFGVFLS